MIPLAGPYLEFWGSTTKCSRQNVQRHKVHKQKVHDIGLRVHDKRFTTEGSRQKVHRQKVHKHTVEIEAV